MSDNAQKLGSLIYGEILPPRDAVHIAIIPGKSNARVLPGSWVKYNLETKLFDPVNNDYEADGIVDPFISPYSKIKDAAFWVCLKPGSILSLRHSWVHKTIPPEATNEVNKKEYSRSWLEGFAGTADMDYDELMWAARNYLENGEYVCEGGRYQGFDFPEKFWDHYENITGVTVNENDRGTFFTCSC